MKDIFRNVVQMLTYNNLLSAPTYIDELLFFAKCFIRKKSWPEKISKRKSKTEIEKKCIEFMNRPRVAEIFVVVH